jgi:hypothetical protein
MIERAAILQIHPAYLRELLQLPDGATLDRIEVPHDRAGLLELRIRGAGWPTVPGEMLTRTTGTVTVLRDAEGREVARTVDWGLPRQTATPAKAEPLTLTAADVIEGFAQDLYESNAVEDEWAEDTQAEQDTYRRLIKLADDLRALKP